MMTINEFDLVELLDGEMLSESQSISAYLKEELEWGAQHAVIEWGSNQVILEWWDAQDFWIVETTDWEFEEGDTINVNEILDIVL